MYLCGNGVVAAWGLRDQLVANLPGLLGNLIHEESNIW